MEFKTTEQRYRDFLDTLPLSTLRILGRQYGVSAASSSNKRALIGDIIAILTGKVSPAPRTNRGARSTLRAPCPRARPYSFVSA